MVLRTFHGQETGFDGLLLPEGVEALEHRLEQLGEKLPAGSDRPKLGPLTRKYMANREHAVALDAALRSVTDTKGVVHFKSTVGPLTASEFRYDMPFDDLPPDVKANSIGMKKRSCIFNITTEEPRLEVEWGSNLPSMWACSDMGSDTWQHRLKYFYKYMIRGSEKCDPPHRHVRNRETAINRSGCAFVKVEFGVVFSFVRGPWKSEANLQLVQEGAKELFRNFDENVIVFNMVYERISRARNGGLLPLGFGTEGHTRATWLSTPDGRILTGLWEEYATNRWACWAQRFEW